MSNARLFRTAMNGGSHERPKGAHRLGWYKDTGSTLGVVNTCGMPPQRHLKLNRIEARRIFYYGPDV